MPSRILVADDETSTREALEEILKREGYEVVTASEGGPCLDLVSRGEFDVILADLVMPGASGLKILKAALEADAAVKVIMVTGYGTIETAVGAMSQGAFHYLTKPVKPAELKELIRRALDARRLMVENQSLKNRLDDRYGFETIIGKGPAVRQLVEKLRRVAPTRSTVLLTGESGTGKELAASCIQHNSPRRHASFVKVNCGTIVESLFESELFGHMQGSFTGAVRDKPGKFEVADGGTLFLDEVAEMSLAIQAKFLRVLQEGEFERVGDLRTRKVDVRVIAATNRNLAEQVAKREFREDLYYRLKVVAVELPPLRDRREDVPLFVDYFLQQLTRYHGKKIEGMSGAVLEKFMAYPWPGNIRELKNTLEGMLVVTANSILQVDDLPPEILNFRESVSRLQVPVGATLEDIEKEMIRRTLTTTQGNRTRAARMLGVSLRTLQRKLKLMDAEEAGVPVSGDDTDTDTDEEGDSVGATDPGP